MPEATFNLVRLCQRYFGSEPLMVGRPDCRSWHRRRCRHAEEEVGADRVANAVAAQDRYQPPLIVVDFGTATTFDVVDRMGNYCGGIIAPGINLSLQALDMAAAQLPRDRRSGARPLSSGASTVPAMQSGVFWGYVGLIEGLVQRDQSRAWRGDGSRSRPAASPRSWPERPKSSDRVDPDLTLWGLRLIYRRNSNK